MDQRAIDVLPDAVVFVAADGIVLDVNDRCRTVLGVGPGAVGRGIGEVLELRDGSGRRLALPPRRSAVADRTCECVVQVVDPSGRERPVAIAGRWSDQVWVLSARSAGRREILERVRGDVVATVSHELRSPLASVKGFSRTLIARWERFSDEQKLTMLRTIDADADRVTRLLSDLLEVSRIDAGRVQLARSPVDLAVLCAAVIDKARHREASAGRQIVADLDAAGPVLRIDADRMEQVLTNLVDNALEHAREGCVTLALVTDGAGVRITVSDQGPGVPTELRDAIFRKFGRGRSTRRAGSGLGLYIGRGITEAHGGRLWLDPQPGPGARFHLWLPAAAADPVR